jgi:hypothetical protein
MGKEIAVENTCPLEAVRSEPFIARCCRSERGVGWSAWNGTELRVPARSGYGTWGSGPFRTRPGR